MSKQVAGFLNRFTIRTQLLLLFGATALVLTISVMTFALWWDIESLKNQKQEQASVIAQVMAQDFVKVLILDSPDIAADAVTKLQAFPTLLQVNLLNAARQPVFQFSTSEESPALANPDWHLDFHVDDSMVQVLAPVRYEDIEYGQAYFRFSRADIDQRFAEFMLFLAGISFLIIIIAVWLAAYISEVFSSPLSKLHQTLKKIAIDPNYHVHLSSTENNEFGALLSGFNDMIRRTHDTGRRLRLEKERLQITLASIGDGVISTNSQGEVEFLNAAAEKILGAPLDAIRGRNLEEFCPLHNEDDEQVLINPVSLALEQNALVNLHERAVLRNAQNKTIAVEVSAAPIQDDKAFLIGAVVILRDVGEARLLEQKLQYQATHDALTGLINRVEFEMRLEDALAQTEECSECALLYLDLDKFKVVNDQAGHAAGDALLQQISFLLLSQLRADDILARLGGDEFGILLKHCSAEDAVRVAQKLTHSIQQYRFNWNERLFSVGCSIGVVAVCADEGDVGELLRAADSACYAAKEKGSGQVLLFEEQSHLDTLQEIEMAWVDRIQAAMAQQRLQLYRQSIVNSEKVLFAYEFFIRLQEKDGSSIPAGAFLSAAERYGMMVEIDRWVFAQVTDWLAAKVKTGQAVVVSVNISAASLADEQFAERVLEIWQEKGLKGEWFILEIAETLISRELAQVAKLIASLSASGCRFAVDDFGSGVSSFSYLRYLDIDFVKIDGAFVKSMLHDETDWAMVKSINEIVKSMGKQSIAEMVENEDICHSLREIGVDFLQGEQLSKPSLHKLE